jgi:hypothetical protein
MANKTINQMLKDKFKAKFVDAAVRHFEGLVTDYQQSEWEDSITKGGRFVEAVLKAIWDHAGETVPTGKAFSAGNMIDQLAGKTVLRDSLRLTIPRACRFVYEIASNRGARHDADEVEANEMDASAVLPACSWILAEMTRYSQKGLDLAEAKAIVEGVMKRKFPFTEEINGRVYVDIAESAREAGLLILWHAYPKRVAEDDLADMLERHGYKANNAKLAVSRLRKAVDDENGKFRLRNIGVREAEGLIEKEKKKGRK